MQQRLVSLASRGQALAEFALTFPIAILVIFAVVVLGLYVFYQQQLTNVAREAARYAAIHSSTAVCSTSSWRTPQAPPVSYAPLCDGPINPADAYPWPFMTDHARSFAWGIAPTVIQVNACWSGYVPPGSSGYQADFPAVDPVSGVPNDFVQCTIDGIDPIADSGSLDCRTRMTTSADDPASDIPGNQVTAYACFPWTPPLAGVLMIPSQITMRAVVTEVIHRQQ